MIIEKKKFRVPVVLLIFGVVFCVASAIFAINTPGDWFARSGAVLSFISVVVQFFISNLKRSAIESLFQKDLGIRHKFNVVREKDMRAEIVSDASVATGLLGTIIWGYGDLFYF